MDLSTASEGTALNDPSDERLLDLYFQGDAGAFQTFFNRHAGRVLAYGIAKGLERQDALDFTQDVFMKLHRGIHRYERGRPALPWFFSIVHHVLVDALRRRRTRAAHLDVAAVEAAAADLAAASTEPATELSAESGTASLDGLSAAQRQVVQLRVLDELSFREISKRTGSSEVAARKTFERALKSLRKLTRRET